MSYKLFLDDQRNLSDVTWGDFRSKFGLLDNVVVVRTYSEFVRAIMNAGLPSVVSFDHDLADEHYQAFLNNVCLDHCEFTEKTGYDCAKFLFEYCLERNLPLPSYHVHSMNPIGVKRIEDLLSSFESVKEKLK